jgi:hypothetical protein
MRNLILGVVGAAAVAFVTPAAAQVHVDVPGAGVHVGGGHHHHHHRGAYRARARANCREVTTRTVRPNGTVVIRKSMRCR